MEADIDSFRALARSGPWRWSYRADGLVASRPAELGLDFDDPMWTDYRWVAMLDPVELSTGVELSDLRVAQRAGRDTWWARAVPVEGYDPRCSCCPLLWSQVSDDLEYGDSGRARYSTDYPDAYDVALDVHTAIVVEVQAFGGRPGLSFAVEILEVDVDLTELVAAHV